MQRQPPVSRRFFLKASSATGFALGLGTMLPNLFLNRTWAATGESPGSLIRIGCIGVGNQGTGNMKKVLKNVVAVCDVDSERLAKARQMVENENQSKCAAYKDYRQMLESKEIDAVLISTPDHWHALPTIHACQAGKDVYCEKPLTLTIGEGKAMVKAARNGNRIVQTGSQQRSDARFRKAAEVIRSGRLGRIKRVVVGLSGVNWTKEPAVPDSEPPPELDYDLWLGPAPKRPYNKHRVHYYFRFFWDYSGGQMTNWGAHHLDIAQWALGKDDSGPVEISGTSEYDPEKRFEVPTRFDLLYRYADGVRIECSSPDAKYASRFPANLDQAASLLEKKENFTGCIFEGDKGLLYVNRGVLRSFPLSVSEDPLKDTEVHLYESANHFENWLDCVRSRKLPICDVAIGHRSATVCHLGNIAIKTGGTLRWDPLAEQVVGNPAAAAMVNKPYRAPWALPV